MNTRKTTNDTPTDENLEGLTYEQAIERVESITDRIESGEVGIEDAVREYEKAMALLKRCRSILDDAEQRITDLSTSDEADTGDESEA